MKLPITPTPTQIPTRQLAVSMATPLTAGRSDQRPTNFDGVYSARNMTGWESPKYVRPSKYSASMLGKCKYYILTYM